MIIKMAPTSDAVSVRLTIDGVVDWAYLVSSPDHDYKDAGTSNAPIDLPLGQPANLNLDPVEWTVHLGNVSAADVDYSVTLDFMQAGDVLDSWSKEGTVKSSDEAVLDDKAILVISKVADV